MKLAKILLFTALFLSLYKADEFMDEGLEDSEFSEGMEDHMGDEEGLEEEDVHETNEINPARQTVDVDVPIPNHDIRNSFVLNLAPGQILDIQAIKPTISVPNDSMEAQPVKKKKVVKKHLM